MTPAAQAALEQALAAGTAEALLSVLPVLEVALCAAYNADDRQHRKCNAAHPGGSGHFVAGWTGGPVCPGHSIALLHVRRRRAQAGDWQALRDELQRAVGHVRVAELRGALDRLVAHAAARA